MCVWRLKWNIYLWRDAAAFAQAMQRTEVFPERADTHSLTHSLTRGHAVGMVHRCFFRIVKNDLSLCLVRCLTFLINLLLSKPAFISSKIHWYFEILQLHYSCDGKTEFSAAITPGLSVAWSFRNLNLKLKKHSLLLWMFKKVVLVL